MQVLSRGDYKKNEICNGFIDRTSEWFKTLANILKKYDYILRYQWSFGTKIGSYPSEICMSFKSNQFKGNGLPDYFTS